MREDNPTGLPTEEETALAEAHKAETEREEVLLRGHLVNEIFFGDGYDDDDGYVDIEVDDEDLDLEEDPRNYPDETEDDGGQEAADKTKGGDNGERHPLADLSLFGGAPCSAAERCR